MKIASILPYKENYTKQGAGAVALWISDFMRDSIYKKNTFVFGNTKYKNFLTKNYTNINISNINSKLNSTTKEYSSKIITKIKTINFDIIELHNRPIMVEEFFKKADKDNSNTIEFEEFLDVAHDYPDFIEGFAVNPLHWLIPDRYEEALKLATDKDGKNNKLKKVP